MRFEKWLPVVPVVLALILFAPAVTYQFVYDDHPQVDTNPYLRIWPGLSRVLLSDVWELTDWPSHSNYFRPLFFLSNWFIVHALSGSSWAFHLVNVLLHAIVVALVWFVSDRMFHDRSASLIAATLFAVHPVHTEAVIWVAAIPDLGCAAFFLLALYFYTQWDSSPSLAPWLCLGCFFVSVLWKELGITFLGVVVAYDILVAGKIRWRRYLPIVSVSGLYFLWRYLALGGFAPVLQHRGLSVLAPVSGLGQYVAKLIVPHPLSIYYPQVTSSVFNVLALIVLFAVVAGLWRTNRNVAWALLWIPATLSPFILSARIPVTFSERNLYLASVGYCWAIALGLTRLKWKFRLVLPIALVSVFVVLTAARMPAWHDDFSLYAATLKIYPDAEIIRVSLATELTRIGRREDAIRQLDLVLENNPAHVGALENKANLRSQQGDWATVRKLCGEIAATDPKALRCLTLLANADQAAGNMPAALRKLDDAISRDPRAPLVRFYRGNIYAEMKRFDDAIADYGVAMAEHPTAEAFNNAGSAYFQSGQPEAAAASYEAALKLNPAFGLARENLDAVLEWRRRHAAEGIPSR